MEHLLLLYMGYVLIFILENISIIYNVALQKTETEQSFGRVFLYVIYT